MTPQRISLVVAIGLVVTTTGLSALALQSLSGAPSRLGPVRLDMAAGEDLQTWRILKASPGPAELAQAERHARRALQLAPFNNQARLRLAYISTQRERAFGPQAQKLLATSYVLIPFDLSIAASRTRFALDNWPMLLPEDRLAARKEAFAFNRSGSRTANIRNTLTLVSNPNGRLAAGLWLRSMSAPAPTKAAPAHKD